LRQAVWFKDDPEVEPLLRESDFYIIGGRPEIKFSDFHKDDDSWRLSFNVTIEGALSDTVTIDIRSLPSVTDAAPETLWIELGPKFVRIWDGPEKQDGTTVLEWFTTEKLLMDRSHGRSGVEGLDRHAEFAVYDLLYVGISQNRRQL